MKQISMHFETEDYYMAEAYKTLRTNLLFTGDDKKVIAITSCTPNEGKSTTALHLAKALGESGKRTILLDADLRKSILMGHIEEDTTEVRGLTHLLSGQDVLANVMYQVKDVPLFVIFSGPFPPNPSELLGSKRFKDLIKVLRDAFDYVIIDTPPVGSVIDSAVVADASDGVILVIAQGTISYRFAQDIKDQLERTGTPLLGVVLNKVDMAAERYGRYYGKYNSRYYGKYYGRYYGQ